MVRPSLAADCLYDSRLTPPCEPLRTIDARVAVESVQRGRLSPRVWNRADWRCTGTGRCRSVDIDELRPVSCKGHDRTRLFREPFGGG
jgi:hypothetical protein